MTETQPSSSCVYRLYVLLFVKLEECSLYHHRVTASHSSRGSLDRMIFLQSSLKLLMILAIKERISYAGVIVDALKMILIV